MSVRVVFVSVLFILQISFVLVHPKTLVLRPDTDDIDLSAPKHEEDDDDLTRHSLTRLRVDGPAAEVVQLQDKILRRQAQARQEDDDDETTARPEIPAIIPGVTKIVNGLLTGSINDILHGAFSFAPKNTTYAINTVYNSVVGLPPPTTRSPPTLATSATVAAAAATTEAEEDEDTDAGSAREGFN